MPDRTVANKIAVPGIRIGTSATAGQVLTADASGYGTWQASTGGGSSGPSYGTYWKAANIPFTDGDTVRRVTITDAEVGLTSKINGSIRRPNVASDSADYGYLYTANVVNVGVGSFDILIVVTDGNEEPLTPPNEVVQFVYALDTVRISTDTVPAFEAKLTADQSIANPNADVMWTGEMYDTANMHNPAVNPDQIVIPTSGLYLITANVSWAAVAGGVRNAQISVNGGGIEIDAADASPGTADATRQSMAGVVRLNAGDIVRLGLYHNSGSAKTINASYTSISVTWVGGAGPTINENGLPAVRAYAAGVSQAVGIGGTALINFPSEDYDTDQLHDPTTNNTRLTCRTPGIYNVVALMRWNVTTGGNTTIELLKNGVSFTPQIAAGNDHSGQWHMLSTQVLFNGGDYLEIRAANGTGGALSITDASFAATLATANKTVIPRARIYRSAALSHTATGTWQKIALDAIENGLDNDTMFDSVNGRLVCKTAGTYTLNGLACFVGAAGGVDRIFAIKVNGNAKAFGAGDISASRWARMSASCTVDLAVNDYIELFAYQDTGGNLAYGLSDQGGNTVFLDAVKAGQSNPGSNNDPGWVQSGTDLYSTNSGMVRIGGITGPHALGHVGVPYNASFPSFTGKQVQMFAGSTLVNVALSGASPTSVDLGSFIPTAWTTVIAVEAKAYPQATWTGFRGVIAAVGNDTRTPNTRQAIVQIENSSQAQNVQISFLLIGY